MARVPIAAVTARTIATTRIQPGNGRSKVRPATLTAYRYRATNGSVASRRRFVTSQGE